MTNTKLGIHDFLTMTDEFHPEWSLFAVEASMENIRKALSALNQSREPNRNISTHLQTVDGNLHDKLKGREFAYAVPVVKLSNSSWIIVYWEVFHGGVTACDQAKSLSAKLSTRAVSLLNEDTSDVLGYELWDKGDCLEKAQCCPDDGEGIVDWESKLRPEPVLEFLDDVDDDFDGDDEAYEREEERISNHNESIWCNFISFMFSDWGIYLPAFYPINESSDVRIEIEGASEGSIESIDLVYPA